MRIWWTTHYQIPITDGRWGESYFEDTLQEFLEYSFANDDEKARAARLKHLGYEHALSGDPYVDMWLKELSEGRVPDLTEGEDRVSKERDAKVRKEAYEHYLKTGELIYKARYYHPLKKEWIDPNEHHAAAAAFLGQDDNDSLAKDPLAKDPLAVNFDGSDHPAGSFDYEQHTDPMSTDAFDELINAVGAIKKD